MALTRNEMAAAKKARRRKPDIAPDPHSVKFEGEYPAQFSAEAWSYRLPGWRDVLVQITANGEHVATMSFRISSRARRAGAKRRQNVSAR